MVECSLNEPTEGMLAAGHYAHHLATWTAHVSRKQLMVVSHQSLKNDPERVVRTVVSHYGLLPGNQSTFPSLSEEEATAEDNFDDVSRLLTTPRDLRVTSPCLLPSPSPPSP